MKIGFFGTPEIAREVLEHLCHTHDVVFVVSSVDKPQGRSKKLCKPPIKVCAEEQCVEILQPDNIKEPMWVDVLSQFEADIFIVFAYGHIIPKAIFEMPPLGTINLHPSLLPEFRGAAPVQWALIEGKDETGVSIQVLEEALDSGPIVAQEKLTVDPDWDCNDLYDHCIPLGIKLLDKAISGLADKSISPTPQDGSKATYCGKINRDIAHIDWNQSSSAIHNLVRGLNPKPHGWTSFRDKEIKVVKTRYFASDEAITLKPGELLGYHRKRLLVGTGDGLIEVTALQPAGKKLMNAAGFLNGARLDENDFFV